MNRQRLSLSSLKRSLVPRIPTEQRSVASVVERPEAFGLSRRHAIKLAGALTLAAAPLAGIVQAAVSTSYVMVRRGRRIVFLVAGVERWSVDPDLFDGTPSVHASETDAGIVVTLRDALFPGTQIRADVEAHISRGISAQATFRFAALGATESVDFVQWLLDTSAAHLLRTSAIHSHIGADASVAIASGVASFRPSWVLTFASASMLTADKRTLLGSRCSVMALAKDAPSLTTGANGKRSLVRVERGDQPWEVKIDPTGLADWQLVSNSTSFDACSLEVRSDGQATGMMEAAREGATLLNIAEAGITLPLRDLRYAWAMTEKGRHDGLVARYAKGAEWTHIEGVSVELGDREGIPPLEIERRGQEITRLIVAPGLKRYVIPVSGAVTEPTTTHPLYQLALLTKSVKPSALPKPHMHLASLQVDLKQTMSVQSQVKDPTVTGTVKKSLGKLGKAKFTMPNNPRVTVIRPDDLLVLTFEFQNITLNKSGGTFSGGGSGSRLIVHFQPQHIAERAFFYTGDKPADQSAYPPGDQSKKTSSDEPLLDPPIDAAMAHPSRLSFQLPSGYSGKYSIEGLLDWKRFTLAVSPSAKPPAVESIYSSLASSTFLKYASVGDSEVKDAKSSMLYVKKKGISTGKKYTVNAGASSRLTSKKQSRVKSAFESQADLATSLADSTISDILAAALVKPPIKWPELDETAIEYPYRLFLSPNKYAGFAHRTSSGLTPDQRKVELWHTRLGVRHTDGSVNENAEYFRTVRAIWSPDYGTARKMQPIFKERPFRTSLNRRDRSEIVDLTSNYGLKFTETEPVKVKRLMLTSLGAWMDGTGSWDPHPDDDLEVEGWVQRGAQGRDTFVRVAYKGYLYPFGNRATLIKETERKFVRTPRGDMAAYLMQRMFIILKEPVREFPADGLDGMEYEGREFPFRRVTITTKMTPNLELPKPLIESDDTLFSSNSFWPMFSIGGGAPQDVRWNCIATDWDNNTVQFSVPLAFLTSPDCAGSGSVSKLQTFSGNKNGSGDASSYVKQMSRRTVEINGQKVAFAPSIKRGDTSFPTAKFYLHGYANNEIPVNTPRFFPRMEKSTVAIEKVQELLGTSGTNTVKFYEKYLAHAFEAGAAVAKGASVNVNDIKNPTQMFLALQDALNMDFGAQSDKGGGLAAPSIGVDALSRLMGPIQGKVNDLANSAAAVGNFDPMEYFAGLLNSKILGDITLKDVLDFVQGILNNMDKMPGLDKKDDFGIKDDIDDIKAKADEVKAEAEKLVADVAAEVNAAKAALKAEVDAVKSEIQGYINAGKKAAEDRIKEWKKRIDDKINELKSEIDKALEPLIEAGNEAAEKYKEVAGALEGLKKGLQLVYEWQTEIKGSPGNILMPRDPGATDKDDKAILYLKAEFIKKLNLDPPEVKLYGSLSNFIINLIGDGAAQFLIITFNKLSFSAKIGEKPSINPDIASVEFAGPLSFVNKLKDLIPKGGGGGGVGFSFDFNVLPSGITASLTIGLPNVTVGVFSLQNMAFIMSITIPFDGRPFSAYFAFCTKDNSFCLTIMMFAGGGFFGIEITPSGVRMLEAAFEFGGNFGFDCGVASGGASVMAGVYYKLESKEIEGKMVEQSELTGYFRLTGNLSILGLIRISLLFELKLTWQSNGKVFGVATIEVEIEILFISFSVGVTVERQLKGSDGDPTFKDALPEPSLWELYCSSFEYEEA
ncbi:MAG: apolipoprotein A1/A4/E family protein [Ignavibacteria bacterium]|nr:apolipoprotein A1/A4/E family protein [Ignavibacteria bacterium]